MNYRERRIWDCTFAAAFVALGPDRDVRADEAMRMADLAVLKVRHLGGPLEGEEEVGCNVCDEDDRDPILRFVEAAVRWCDTDRGSAEESEAFNDLAEARGVLPSDFSAAKHLGVNRYLVDTISSDGEEGRVPFAATFTSKWGNGVDVEVPPGTKRIRVTVLHPEKEG